MGSMMTFDGAEMNEPPMPSGADVDEIVVAVTVKREVAAMNESMMPSGSNDEELVLEVAVERHEAAMKTT